MQQYKKFLSIKSPAIAGLTVGFLLAGAISVFATNIGTDITATGDVTVTSGARVGTGSTGDHITALGDNTLFVQGQSEHDGIAWFDGSLQASSTLVVTGTTTLFGGLGLGTATSAQGNMETTGNTLFGDAVGDLVMLNAGNLIFNNPGTTTIPAANAASFAISTTTSGVPFLRFDTSNYRIGISTSSPGVTFTVGGAGNIYALGGLGVGVSTTTSGNLEMSGSALFGDAAADRVMLNAASLIFNNSGTTTIPAATAAAWAIATTSDSIPFMRFDTSNYRIGISTTTPGATFTVGGAGNVYALGGLGVGVSTTTQGNIEASGSVQLGDAAADRLTLNGAIEAHSTQGTTTLTASAYSWGFATTTAEVPLMRYDTTNTRVGISTTTPGAMLAVASSTYTGGLIVGGTGTYTSGILSGWTDCGPANGLATTYITINASTTGIIACQGNIPNVTAGDKIWLTASSTGFSTAMSWIYTGVASSTANGRIQAQILNLSSANYTVASSTWMYLIIK